MQVGVLIVGGAQLHGMAKTSLRPRPSRERAPACRKSRRRRPSQNSDRPVGIQAAQHQILRWKNLVAILAPNHSKWKFTSVMVAEAVTGWPPR